MLDVDFIIKIIEKKGYTCASIERELGFGNGSIRRWKTNSPSINKLFELSNFLNIDISSLLKQESYYKDSKSNEENYLIDRWSKLSEKQKGIIEGRIEQMIEDNLRREKNEKKIG